MTILIYRGELLMDNTFEGFRPRSKLEQFTAIPNEFFDEVMKNVNGNELKILLSVFRKTYGWVIGSDDKGNPVYKTQDSISLSQFQDITGIKSINTVKKYLKSLIDKGYIIQTEDYDAKKNKSASYALHKNNKHQNDKCMDESNINKDLYQNLTEVIGNPVSNIDRAPVSKFDSTKERTKEITKERNKNNKEEEEVKFEFKLSTEKFNEKTLSLFKQVFGHYIRPYELKILNKYNLSDEVIRKGIELSGTHNAQSLQYLVDILDTWVNQGYKTVEDIERHIRAFKGEESVEDYYDKGYR